jgi:hypothetical protein
MTSEGGKRNGKSQKEILRSTEGVFLRMTTKGGKAKARRA